MTSPKGRNKGRATSPGDAVIDNTLFSRLIYLELADFLPFIFKQIRIPPEVRKEAARSQGKLKKRLAKKIAEMKGFFIDCREADEMVAEFLKADLDRGEAAAIAQAAYLGVSLLIDEEKGTKRAKNMSIEVIRTGRLLLMLKEAGAIEEVRPYLDRLKHSDFFLKENVYKDILQMAGEEII